MFWGAIVKPNEPIKLEDSADSDILRLSTAVLGTQANTGKTTLVAEVEGKKHILAHLVSDRTSRFLSISILELIKLLLFQSKEKVKYTWEVISNLKSMNSMRTTKKMTISEH